MRPALLLALSLSTGCVRTADDGDGPTWSSWEDAPATERVSVRVATWNVEGVGQPGTAEFEATLSVLRRLDADVVGLNEVDEGEQDALEILAAEAGYPTVVSAPGQPFGSLGNAVLARLPELRAEAPTAPRLSGDADANDVTRLPILFTGDLPGLDAELSVVAVHFKSGFDPADAFRRNVDAVRTAQAADLAASSDYVVVLGDVNENVDELPPRPAAFTSLPPDLPFSYRLGTDVDGRLGDGLPDDPFAPLDEAGFRPLDAFQRDGAPGTRPASGRRIDYVFADAAVRGTTIRAEVYDSAQEDDPGLADGDERVDPNASRRASDHLPILVEFRVAADPTSARGIRSPR